MSATLVLTMALAGGHGCPSSGWHSPGYATHYGPSSHGAYYAPRHHMTYSAPVQHGAYFAPNHGTFHAPGHSTHYRYQPRTCAGGRAAPPQTFGESAGGYGAQHAPQAPYSEGYDSRRRDAGAAPPPPDVPGANRRQAGAARGGQRGAPAAVIEMTNEARFQPERVTITVGQSIEWRNTSDHAHTVTADPQMGGDNNVMLPEGAEPFDSREIRPGETFRHTFDTPGRYRYVCLPHQDRGMIGEIEVLDENQRGEQGGRGGRDAGRAPDRGSEPERPEPGGGARY